MSPSAASPLSGREWSPLVVVRAVRVENRCTPQPVAFDGGHLGEVAHFLEVGADGVALLVDDVVGFGFVEVVDLGAGDAYENLSSAGAGTIECRRLRGLAT